MSHSLLDLSTTDIIGFGLISIGLAVGSSGGIGGGSIAIPLLILIQGFSTKNAIPLGNTAVLGSSISNIIFSIYKTHPLDETRSIIDWDVISMMEPMTMVGAVLGAYLHSIIPDWFTRYALVIILTITSLRMLYKGVNDLLNSKTFNNKLEYQVILSEHDSESSSTNISKITSPNSILYQSEEFIFTDIEKSENVKQNPELKSYYIQSSVDDSNNNTKLKVNFEIEQSSNSTEEERKQPFIPLKTVGILTILFTGTVIINLAQGSQFIASTIKPYNSSSVLSVILIIYMLSMALWLRQRVIYSYNKRISNPSYAPVKGEIQWNSRNSILYPVASSTAGIIAGLFGIGGGIVKAPLMIEMGIHPLVVASTSTVMIFFTAITAASSYFVYGVLQWDYAFILFVLGIISNIIGQTIVSKIIQYYKSSSIITILLAFLIGVSALLMTLASAST